MSCEGVTSDGEGVINSTSGSRGEGMGGGK